MHRRLALGIGVIVLLGPRPIAAQLQEMRQTIFGMD